MKGKNSFYVISFHQMNYFDLVGKIHQKIAFNQRLLQHTALNCISWLK